MNWLNLGESISKNFQFDYTDATKTLRHAGIVGLASCLSVLIENVSGMNFGTLTPILLPAISIALNAAMRWAKSNE